MADRMRHPAVLYTRYSVYWRCILSFQYNTLRGIIDTMAH